MTDIEKIKAEIERRIDAYSKNLKKADNTIARINTDARRQGLIELLSFIESLPKEEITEQQKRIVIPQFRVGDTIRLKNSNAEYKIIDIYGGCYHGQGWQLDIINCDKSGYYELVKHESLGFMLKKEQLERLESVVERDEEEYGFDETMYDLLNQLKALT